MTLHRVRLFLSTEHNCGYLPDRAARSLFVDPEYALDSERYGSLLEQGFRRGGNHVYRPRCTGCKACIPARVAVKEFKPNRAQRRCLKLNADLQLRIADEPSAAQFELYQRYLRVRHDGGGMNPDDHEGFENFLRCDWGSTEFWEFSLEDKLICCAVVDHVTQGLSAVYSFFDPNQSQRSLGTYSVLRQISSAAETGLDYLYLGYWVPGSPKMDYKRNFRSLEVLGENGWEPLPDEVQDAELIAG